MAGKNKTQEEKQENFLKLAHKIHGDKYDYSKTVYTRTCDKLEIICPIHGSFWMLPYCHVGKQHQGCPECGKVKRNNSLRSNKEEFVRKAREIHGDKYDYSKVEYVGADEKVTIICPKHGEFYQRPRIHLCGRGCNDCGLESMAEKERMTTDQFIEKARKIHGNRYDYSKVDYKKSEEEICIICPEHGEFWMTPHWHIRGGNCPKCSCKYPLGEEKFIEMARKIHGNKYIYDQVEYKNNQTKVKIICPTHGVFEQVPSSHLSGSGCPKCGDLRTSEREALSHEEFITRSKEIHGNKYDYSKTLYNRGHISVTITCPEHGDFTQLPQKHLGGHGCPECGKSYNIKEEQTLSKLKKEFDQIECQKRFDFLSFGSGVMKLDFYLPEYNVAIEYHGIQHFKPVSMFGGEDAFNKQRERDLRKYNLCKEHGIKIYYLCSTKDLNSLNYFEKLYNNIDKMIKDIKNNKNENIMNT